MRSLRWPSRLAYAHTRDQLGSPLFDQLARGFRTERDGGTDVSRNTRRKSRGTVRAEDHGIEMQLAVNNSAPSTDGCQTATAQGCQQRALRQYTSVRVRIIELLHDRNRGLIVLPSFQSERSLSNGGKHHRGRQKLRDAICQTKSFESRFRENDGVVFASVELLHASFDIAANIQDRHIRAGMQQLRLATPAAGSHSRAVRQLLDRCNLIREKGIVRAFARRNGCQT